MSYRTSDLLLLIPPFCVNEFIHCQILVQSEQAAEVTEKESQLIITQSEEFFFSHVIVDLQFEDVGCLDDRVFSSTVIIEILANLCPSRTTSPRM